jgi:hypothetical protein
LVIRQKVENLSVQSRSATGVLIQKIPKDDFIVVVDIVTKEADAPTNFDGKDAKKLKSAVLDTVSV